MSVLLDALKKAAEEKKSLQESSNDSSNHEAVTSLEEEVIQPSLSEQIEQEKEVSADEVVEQNSDEFTFKLATNDNSKDLDLFSEQNEQREELPEFDVDSLSESNTPTEPFDVSADNGHDKTLDIVDHEPRSPLELSTPQTPQADFSISDISQENSLDSIVDSLDIDDALGSKESGNVSQFNHKDDRPVSDFNVNENDEPLVVEPQKDKTDNFIIANDTKASSELDTQSFDWSLDDLPGYNVDSLNQQNSSGLKVEQNPILVSGAHSTPQKAKNRYATSSKVFVTLFVFLMFVLIGFYGILYFQEQNEKLEKSMMKYNIASLKLQPKNNESGTSTISITEKASGIATNTNELKVVPKASDLGNQNQDIGQEDQASLPKKVAASTPTKTEGSKPNQTANATVSTYQKTVESVAIAKNKPKTIKKYQPKKVISNTSKSVKRSVSKPVVVTINKTKSLIAEAYEAYSSGNYAKSGRLFENALNNDANNTKALMGLGAVSVVNKNYSAAIRYYEKVLAVKPNDLNAFEAIANLAGLVPLNNDWDQELASVASNYPQSAVLQNALGNSFASKNDWLEAQKAYFNAVVNNSSSADYMMNLAVSYDHLGEYKLAAQYYTKALAHAQNSRASFNSQQVKSRLVSIKQLMIKGG